MSSIASLNLKTMVHSGCITLHWASQVVVHSKEPTCNAGDTRDSGSVPGWGRSPGGGHSNPLQYSCLENSMDRGAWSTTVPGVAESQTRLKRLSTQFTFPPMVYVQGFQFPHILTNPFNPLFILERN